MSKFVEMLDTRSGEALAEQLSAGRIQGRDFTGSGFYTNFETPASTTKMFNGLTGVAFRETRGVQFPNGSIAVFMLGFNEGRLAHLEGQMTDVDKWPADVSQFQVL